MYLIAFSSIILFLPFSVMLTYFSMGITGFVWLLGARRNVKSFSGDLFIPLLVFISIFIIQVVGLIHTDNMTSGINKIEGKLSMVVFPLLVFMSPISSRDIRILKWVFIITTLSACFYCHAVVVMKTVEDGAGLWQILVNPQYKYTGYTNTINMHPTYLTLFAAFSFFLLISLSKGFNNRTSYLTLGGLFLYCFLVFFQAVSRAGVAAFIVALLIIAVYEILSATKYRLLSALVLVLFLFATSIFASEFWRNKFLDDFRNLAGSSFAANNTSVGQHIKSWQCAVELITTDYFLFGYGTGDEKDVLAQCYQAHQWDVMVNQKNDAHNEYLSTAIRHGIIGVAVLLFFFAYALNRAWQTRDMLYLAFLVMFIIICFSESSLKARTSLVYFCMFNALMFKDNYLHNITLAKLKSS